MKRYLRHTLEDDALVNHKMAFIAGPRQVGKSTLAKQFLQHPENYFLYDHQPFQRAWHKNPQEALAGRLAGPIVLDEIHKDRLWKKRLKGIYDMQGHEWPIIVTGSARLDYYRRGSDSLLGRYLPYHLHPISVAERENPISPLAFGNNSKPEHRWDELLHLGGFPEVYLAGNAAKAKRWSNLRLERLVYEDARDFLNISDARAFRLLVNLLPERIGSLLSLNALHEVVGKAYATVRSWYHVLEALYYCFTIRPAALKLARVLQAQPKMYLFDILQIPANQRAKRLENLTALHLLKMCDYWNDSAQGEFHLHFLRDNEQREVDFVVLRDQKPWLLIECKSADKQPAKNLVHFQNKLQASYCVQLVDDPTYDRFFPAHRVRVVSFEKFFSGTI